MLDKFISLIPHQVRNSARDYIVGILAAASSDNRWRKLINSFRSDAEFRDAFDEALGRALLPGPETVLNPPFEAVVWVSAKDRPEQKQWLNEVLDTTARALDYPAIT